MKSKRDGGFARLQRPEEGIGPEMEERTLAGRTTGWRK